MLINNSELAYWYTVTQVKNIRNKVKFAIYKVLKSNNITLSELFEEDSFSINLKFSSVGVPLTQKEIDKLFDKEYLSNNSFYIDSLLKEGFNITPIISDDYPQYLINILKETSPIILYSKGDTGLLNKKCAAIVGSRNASEISLSFTEHISERLVKKDFIIVSGYAIGIDQKALESAIQHGGKSIIVLPQGIKTFSKELNKLYKYIIDGTILVVSQFNPDSKWSIGNAMTRNNLIYGLSEYIVVSESGNSGGTWSGVQEGMKRKQEIFVRKPNGNEDNANMLLISQGAKPISYAF